MKRRIPRTPKHSLGIRAVTGQPIYRPKKRRQPRGLSGTLSMHLAPHATGIVQPPPKQRRRGSPISSLVDLFNKVHIRNRDDLFG
jgi:hypothetical protein